MPIKGERIRLMYVGIGLQWQKIHIVAYNVRSLFYHLAFCYPQGSFGNRNREVIYLYTIELADSYLDDGVFVSKIHQQSLSIYHLYHFILQSAKRQEGFRQEISAATRWVHKGKRRKSILKITQQLHSFFCHFLRFYLFQFSYQVIHKQRVNHLMDIFDACIVHSPTAAGLWIKSALKHGSKYGGTDSAPIKILGTVMEYQCHYLICKPWYLYILVRKQTSVDIRESKQVWIGIFIPLLGLRIQHSEQINQRGTDILCIEPFQIIMKRRTLSKQTRILCIKAKNQSHAKRVKALERIFIRMFILFQKGII